MHFDKHILEKTNKFGKNQSEKNEKYFEKNEREIDQMVYELYGLTKEEILSIDPNIFLNKIGLDTVVSSQRTNGFGQALHKIHNKLKN